jgi:hypothetical protein
MVDRAGGPVMGLTLYWEQRLEAAELVAFFDENRDAWLKAARDALQYARDRFPENSTIRRDDVAQFLVPVIEVDEDFKNHLDSNRLTQKYWAKHFGDLIIDRVWEDVIGQGQPHDEGAKD